MTVTWSHRAGPYMSNEDVAVISEWLEAHDIDAMQTRYAEVVDGKLVRVERYVDDPAGPANRPTFVKGDDGRPLTEWVEKPLTVEPPAKPPLTAEQRECILDAVFGKGPGAVTDDA